MVKRFGLGRKERLKSRKQIDALFLNGRRFVQFPLRVTYQFFPAEEALAQIGVTASRKSFKKAIDRNRLKRLMRESYRLQKQLLLPSLESKKLKAIVFFMYADKTIASFDTVSDAMSKALMKLQKAALQYENPA